MKHIAKIQVEFIKEARKWDDLTLGEQEHYLKRHPKSKRRITAVKKTLPFGPNTPIGKKDVNGRPLYENDSVYIIEDDKSKFGTILNGQVVITKDSDNPRPITNHTKIIRLTNWFTNTVNNENYSNIGLPSKRNLKALSKKLLLPRSSHALYIYDKPELRKVWKNLVKKYKLTNDHTSNDRWPHAIHELKENITNDMARDLFNKYKQILPPQAADYLSMLAAKDPNKYLKYLLNIPKIATKSVANAVITTGVAAGIAAAAPHIPTLIKYIQTIVK